jgi:hypothetical protein
MKTKDLVTIATAALGTATLTVAAFWAGPLDAGSEADAPPAKLAKARLLTKGVEVALATAGGRTFKAGDQAEFELTAVNTTDQAAEVGVGITMTATAPADPMSRTIQMPSALWQREECVKLAPRESKVLTLCASTNLPPNKLITVSLREPGAGPVLMLPGITALSFSTVVPKAAPVVASAL